MVVRILKIRFFRAAGPILVRAHYLKALFQIQVVGTSLVEARYHLFEPIKREKHVKNAVRLADRNLLVAVLGLADEAFVLSLIQNNLNLLQSHSVSVPKPFHQIFNLISPIDEIAFPL